MKRTAIFAGWLVSLVAAFYLGRIGGDGAPAAPPIPTAGQIAESRMLEQAALPTAAPAAAAAHGGTAPDLLAEADALLRDGKPHDALRLVEQHLVSEPRDARALFLLSDLLQMTGRVDESLEPLFAILRFPPTPADAERARDRLALLINAREQQLINAGDLAGLVRYFERLVAADPGFDGYRLKLVRWLLRSGETDAAAQLLKEVGLAGVAPEEIDALAEEIALAQTTLPTEQRGGALYTSVKVRGPAGESELRLLIDTGATMTGFNRSRLEGLGAELLQDDVRVQTANGVALLPVYRILSLEVGPLSIVDLPVLGFEDLPGPADGLLGTDVLGRFSSPGLGAGMVGRP